MHAAYRQSAALALADGVGELIDSGWSSSTRAAFDFRANGSAWPMYALFLVSLVVFSVGAYRLLHGPPSATRPPESAGESNRTGRLGRLFRVAVLQRRILRRGYSGLTHLPIFWGFVVLAAGSLVIMVDSYLLQPLGLGPARGLGYKIFQASLDVFGLAFLFGVCLAIYRRVLLRPEHKPADGPMLTVLFTLLGIGLSGFVLEGLRVVLEDANQPWAFAGGAVAALIGLASVPGDGGLLAYKLLWWCHVIAAFGLIAALPYTALRHAFTSPMNILISPERPSGALTTPFLLRELLATGRFDVKAGADSVDDFSHPDRLGLLACAGSGNCQDVCPAHASGTPLSPMRLVDALRDATSAATPDARPATDLSDGAVSEDAIWSCTLCGACTANCPTLVDPTRYIVALRRGLVAGNRLGAERTAVLANLTRTRNPYGSDGAARENVAELLGVRDASEGNGFDMIYWLGCAATFDSRVRETAKATVKILGRAGIRCAVLGSDEICCGDPARRIGEEGLFQDLALRNIEALERTGVSKIVTHCAHCFNTLRNEYGALGARFEVLHHGALIRDLVASGAIRPGRKMQQSVTLHDACYVGRINGGIEPPRELLRSIPGVTLHEMERSGDGARCCGAGGANYWYGVPRRESIAVSRLRDARTTGARVLVTECPFCLKMLGDAPSPTDGAEGMVVRDIAEVVADSLQRSAK